MNMQIAPSVASSTPVQTGGVCGHSSGHMWQEYIVFCVGQSKVRQQAFKSWALERGLGFKELVGSYKGQQECSFITNYRNLDLILPWIVEEESIMVLDKATYTGGGLHYRDARLVYSDGRIEEIGKFRHVTKGYALAQDAWTYAPHVGSYFVAN